ncbi:MAG: substrate-binding domain-containing protein [Actinomycetota bacterium]|nr:substrate-binding domain-containing protein [Actinomycetota bacterium]
MNKSRQLLVPVLSMSLILTGINASFIATSATAAPKYKVTYIPKNLGNPYFDAIVGGFNKAAKKLKMKVKVVAPAQAGATDQIPYIEAAIQQKVTAIAISPNDANALCPTLKRAMKQGIIVLTVNGDTAASCRQASITPTDFAVLGKYLVDQTAKVMGGPGDWAFLSATSTAPDQNSWLAGAKTYIDGGGQPTLKLVATVYGDDAPEKSATEASALLAKYPNLKAINAPTTVGIAAAAQVLSTSPRKGKVQVTGLGTPNQMRQYIKDGTVKSFSLWDPGLQGQIAANLIKAM